MATTLDLDFTITTTLDPRITFSRASLGTYYDSAGVLRYSAHNIFFHSQDFANVAWPKTRITATADSIAAPDGTMTADTLDVTNPGGQAFVQQSAGTMSPNSVMSVYAKAGTKNWIMFSISLGAASVMCWFDIATGVVGTKGASWLFSGIQSVGNGWYRCYAGGNIPSFTTMLICVGDADNTINANVGGTVYLWGAQLETPAGLVPGQYYMPTAAAANYNGPRFDFDPVTHVAKGLLIEESRVNGVGNSQNFTHAAWTKTGITATADQIVAPDATTTADLITTSASPATVSVVVSVSASAAWTLSVYAKKGTSNWFYLCTQITGTGAQAPKAYFNLDAGTVGTVEAGITAATIQDVGNGWYRCTAASVGASGSEFFMAGLCDADNSADVTVGRTIYLWGAQAEASAAFVSSYIPTSGSTVTRAADVAVMTGSNFSSWYNQSAGTFVAEFDVLGLISGTTQGIITADNNSNQYIQMMRFSNQYTTTLANPSTQATFNSTPLTLNATTKFGLSFATNDIAFCRDGGAVQTDTVAVIPGPLDRLRIGGTLSTNWPLNGYICRIQFMDVAVDDATLQTLPQPPTGTTTPVEPGPGVSYTTTGGSAFWDQDYDGREYESSRKRRKRFLQERERRLAEL